MKKIAATLLLFMSFIGYTQTNGITYQAVIINPSGEELPGVNNTNAPLANKNICLKFSIIDQNSQLEYVETIQTTTDEFGMVNLIIGTGVQVAGYASSFSTIVWNTNPKSLKVDVSTTGICSNYTEISNQPFTAVPFALFASNSQSTAAIAALEATVAANAAATQSALNLKEDKANKSFNIIADANSDIKYPSVKAIKVYVDGKLSTIQAELDATQTGAGLNTNGTYTANASSNYIQTAISLKDADNKLDAEIKLQALANELNLANKLDKVLLNAETIVTSSSNTLSITGLQDVNVGVTNDQVLTVSGTGQIRKTASRYLFKESVLDIIATDGQTQFTTPLPILDTNKINVYRNGIRINHIMINDNTIALGSGVVCYAQDEIKIVQFN